MLHCFQMCQKWRNRIAMGRHTRPNFSAVKSLRSHPVIFSLLTICLVLLLLLGSDVRAAFSQSPSPTPELYGDTLAKTYFPQIFKPAPFVYTNPVTTSVYMKTVKPGDLYNLGCEYGHNDRDEAGIQDSLVILAYGDSYYDSTNDTYGVKMFGTGKATTYDLAEAIKQFGVGYYDCTEYDSLSHIIIAPGTTNSVSGSSSYNNELGQVWAGMVNSINAWFVDKGYSGQVQAAGANDMELWLNSSTNTKAWVSGYKEKARYELYNFGDAAGCPTSLKNGGVCATRNGYAYYYWDMEDVAYISNAIGYAVPEIYLVDGTNAQQWYVLSRYAADHTGARLEFAGLMTQEQACRQRSGCTPTYYTHTNNSPDDAYEQLYSRLSADSATAQELKYSTDIMWWNEKFVR